MTEHLKLPDNAKALWEATREITRGGIAALTAREAEYAIGGGTVLAARWKHRRSRDIDIVVAEETNPGSVLSRPESAFRTEMERLGATVSRKARGKLVSAEWPGQKVDIWATTPMPATGAKPAIVDGRSETLLTTTQILRGKLERGEDCVVRDVYDVVRARELDRPSVVAAVNGAGPLWARTIAGIWEAAKTKIARDAGALDTAMPIERPEQLGADAAGVLRDAIYTKVEIKVERNVVILHGTTGFGEEKPIPITGNRDSAFEELGVIGYLADQGKDGRQALEHALKQLAGGTATQWNAGPRSGPRSGLGGQVSVDAPQRPDPIGAYRRSQQESRASPPRKR